MKEVTQKTEGGTPSGWKAHGARGLEKYVRRVPTGCTVGLEIHKKHLLVRKLENKYVDDLPGPTYPASGMEEAARLSTVCSAGLPL